MRRTFHAPAKVNLLLKVISKRPDGYHNIYSIVDPISLFDTVHLEETTDDVISVKDDKGVLPEGEQNTMFRAARLIKETYAIHTGIRIYVEKRIPIGSGLGGPSSDAAAVLKGLADMWRLSISDVEYARLGKAIGADVPLFLYGKPCIMEGIGDIVSPFDLYPLWYLVVYPGFILQTKEVYGRLKIKLTNGEKNIKLIGNFKNIGGIARSLENDLEQVGITMYPKIKSIKDKLMEAGALGSLMSGSGSSVFGIFGSEEEAERASVVVKDLGRVFRAHSLSIGRGVDYGDNGC